MRERGDGEGLWRTACTPPNSWPWPVKEREAYRGGEEGGWGDEGGIGERCGPFGDFEVEGVSGAREDVASVLLGGTLARRSE